MNRVWVLHDILAVAHFFLGKTSAEPVSQKAWIESLLTFAGPLNRPWTSTLEIFSLSVTGLCRQQLMHGSSGSHGGSPKASRGHSYWSIDHYPTVRTHRRVAFIRRRCGLAPPAFSL